jgi:hypothetical protein
MLYLSRFLWIVSLLGYLYNLFSTYGNLRPDVPVALGSWIPLTGRNAYFFFFLAFFILLNLLFLGLDKALRGLPAGALPLPRYWKTDSEKSIAARRILSAWIISAACTANYFLIYWMLLVENENHFEGNTLSAVGWFHKPGLVMAASLILPAFRFFVKNPDLLARRERDE